MESFLKICDKTDNWFGTKFPVKQSKLKDRIFFIASKLGDHSIIWALITPLIFFDIKKTLIMWTLLLFQSLVTNGPIKWIFKRNRPQNTLPKEGALPYKMRRPITSSMPSGHSSASFFSLTIFTSQIHWIFFIIFPISILISYSRIYVKLHHFSDVIVGVIWGIIFGLACSAII